MSDRIAEIRARLDAATPGPWETYEFHAMGWRVVACDGNDVVPLTAMVSFPDAHLMAHAPADIAWLLDEVERLRGAS